MLEKMSSASMDYNLQSIPVPMLYILNTQLYGMINLNHYRYIIVLISIFFYIYVCI